jgi:hypothetical protein
MRRLRTFCLAATLAVAQLALSGAEGTGTATFTTLSCLMPRAQCTEVSGSTTRTGIYDFAGDEFEADAGGGAAIAAMSTAMAVGGMAIRKGGRSAIRMDSFAALQMNLCNSGIAGCFTGRAVGKAAQMVLERAPALVTVNEACESDVTELLLPAMLTLYRNEWLFWTFAPAANRGIGDPVLCTPDPLGKERGRFGNGAVGRLFTNSRPRFTFEGGLFPDDRRSPDELQDLAHAEMRSWVCANAYYYQACTAHLDNPSATGAGTPEQERVASNQCRYLASLSVPADPPTVILGDLNMGADPAAKYNVLGCTPRGWSLSGDGVVQHALAGNGFSVIAVEVASMARTTDHPALIVSFRLRTAPA